eukprot:15474511-Alexandrium_andersonii.AAC.1
MPLTDGGLPAMPGQMAEGLAAQGAEAVVAMVRAAAFSRSGPSRSAAPPRCPSGRHGPCTHASRSHRGSG